MRRTRLFDSRFEREEVRLDLQRKYVENDELVSEINTVQDLWQATHYPWMSGMTLGELLKRAGGLPVTPSFHPSPSPVSEQVRLAAEWLCRRLSLPHCRKIRPGLWCCGRELLPLQGRGHFLYRVKRLYPLLCHYVGGYYVACNEPEMRLERQ